MCIVPASFPVLMRQIQLAAPKQAGAAESDLDMVYHKDHWQAGRLAFWPKLEQPRQDLLVLVLRGH